MHDINVLKNANWFEDHGEEPIEKEIFDDVQSAADSAHDDHVKRTLALSLSVCNLGSENCLEKHGMGPHKGHVEQMASPQDTSMRYQLFVKAMTAKLKAQNPSCNQVISRAAYEFVLVFSRATSCLG